MLAGQVALSWKSPTTDALAAKSLYNTVEFWLYVFQTAAILEVLHAAVGLVRSNPSLVFAQVLSRLVVVWLVCYPFHSVGFWSSNRVYLSERSLIVKRSSTQGKKLCRLYHSHVRLAHR